MTDTATMRPAQTEFQRWKDQCPLRAWRTTQKPYVSIIDAAGLLGVTMTTIRLWESGSSRPTDRAGQDSVTKLKRVLGEKVMTRWDAWLERRPAL